MADVREFEGRIQLGYDSQSQWYSNGDKIKLGPGEVIGMKLTTKVNNAQYALILGNNTDNLKTLMNSDHFFYSGIGAGYKLPIGGHDGTGKIGGVRVDTQEYFDIDQGTGVIAPTFIRREINEKYGGNVYRLLEENSLQIDGRLYCTEVVAERVVDKVDTILKTPAQYIDINIYDASKGDNTEFTNTLTSTERAGIKIFNYLGSENDINHTVRHVAELSIDNKGILAYSKNASQASMFDQVLTLKRYYDYTGTIKYLSLKEDEENGYVLDTSSTLPISAISGFKTLTLKVDGNNSQTYSPNSSDTTYDIEIPKEYCKTITIDGKSYSASNHIIELPKETFTEDKDKLLSTAVQSIKLNGISGSKSGTSVTLPKIEANGILDVSSNSTIIVSHNEPNGFTNHDNLTTWTTGDVNDMILVVDVDYDDTGHVKTYTKKDFTTIIKDLQDQIKTLQETVNKLT